MVGPVKMLVDCSKPVGDPARAKLVPLDQAELKQLEKDKTAAAEREANPPLSALEVVAQKIENAESLEEVKRTLAAHFRGEA